MEEPAYSIGGYFNGGNPGEFSPEKRHSDQKPSEHFAVDDLLDFPNEDDAIMADGFLDNLSKNYTADSSIFTSNGSCNSSGSVNHISYHNFAGSHFSSELCVPCDDAAELEWLSNFVDDSFSTDQNLQANFHILSGSKPPTPESSSSESNPEPSLRNPIFQPDIPLPGKARSKRSRAAPGDWSTRLLHLSSTAKASSKKQGDNNNNKFNNPNSGTETPVRKCLHCAAEKTPQWRTGPMGPKTLCNACGVRYKSGRLVPEYRPAASPTFVSAKHSNSHRKVVELRRQKELQRAQQQQHYLHQTSIFGVSNGPDDFLISHHSGPTFRHMV